MLSEFTEGPSVQLPPFGNTRILMMPILLQDLATVPEARWRDVVAAMRECAAVTEGTAYLTIDEREVPAGYCHRRPGLHVDGWPEEGPGIGGGWGGGGGWGIFGWITLSSHAGCEAWQQEFDGLPRRFGDCAQLAAECRPDSRVLLEQCRIYRMGNMAVHRSVPMAKPTARQFVRLSLPSEAGWPVSCTPNPFGVEPGGPLLPARPTAFTDYGYARC